MLFSSSMGEGLVFSRLLSRFIFIFFAFLGYDGVSGLDIVNTSLLILLDTLACISLTTFL